MVNGLLPGYPLPGKQRQIRANAGSVHFYAKLRLIRLENGQNPSVLANRVFKPSD
jgi:hypothetical protein